MSGLDVALECAARGWHVFPVKANKQPCTAHGFKDATTDPARITELWGEFPYAGIGIATGASGLIVVDVDCKKDAPGYDSWHEIKSRVGDQAEDTTLVETPSGGLHVYYRANGHRFKNTAGSLAPGIDTRADGGYVVGAGSPGYEYVDDHGPERLGYMPEVLASWLEQAVSSERTETTTAGAAIAEGTRNSTLASLAGTMRRRGIGEAAIEAALLAENEGRCRPPLPDREVRAIAHSVSTYEPAQATVTRTARASASVVCMADVQPQIVTWLWPGWLPAGKISLLIGDPGLGKTMMGIDIAARLTRGRAFPGASTQSAPGTVVFLTAEDGLADTIRPRMDAAGADPSRVFAMQSVRVEGDASGRLFSLAADVDVLEEVVREHNASLVILDPLDSYLPRVDTHRNADVRVVLSPFAAMLERTGATGLCVHHLNKDASTVNALYRAGGSLAFVAAARAVLGVAPDPDDKERSLLLPVKMNLGPKPPGLGYRIDGAEGRIEWDANPVTVDASTALSGPRRADSDNVSAAKEFLLEMLAGGRPVPQLDIDEEAERRDISRKSLSTAKKALRVQSKREGFGRGALWFWQLPEENQP